MQPHRLCALLVAAACGGEPDPSTPAPPVPEPAAEPMGAPTPLPVATGLSDARDAYGDLLPVGAVQRFGMARLRQRGPIEDLAWTPDGSVLVSAGGDGSVRLWAGDTGRPMEGLPGFHATRLAMSRDGSVIAGAQRGGAVRVVSIEDGEVRWTYEPDRDQVNALAFSPDGDKLALATDTGTQVLDALTGVRVQRFGSGVTQVDRVAWSPDGAQVALVDRTGQTTVRGVSDGDVVASWRVDNGGAPVRALLFGPGSAGTAVVTGASVLALHDPATGESEWDLQAPTGVTAVTTGPRGTLVAAFVDHTTSLLRLDTAHHRVLAVVEGAHPHPIQAVASNSARVASGDAAGEIRLWNARSLAREQVRIGHQSELTGLAFSHDGGLLYTAGTDGRLLAWTVESGKLATPERHHPGGVLSVGVSQDGASLVSAGWDGVVREWGVGSARPKRSIPLGEGLTRAALRPDGSIVTWSGRTELAVVDAAGNSRGLGPCTGVFALSADGRWLVATRPAGPVLIDVDTGVVQSELPSAARLAGAAQAIAWAPDASRFALVGADEKIHVVNVQSRTEEFVLRGPAGAITAVAWSPDGRLLATGHQASVRLWDVSDQREIAAYGGHDDWVTGVAFSPDGSLVASAGADRVALLWRVPHE